MTAATNLDSLAQTARAATAKVRPWLNWANVQPELTASLDQVDTTTAEQTKAASTTNAPLLNTVAEMVRRARTNAAAAAPLPHFVGPILVAVLDDVASLATEGAAPTFTPPAALARFVDNASQRNSWYSNTDMRTGAMQQTLQDAQLVSHLPLAADNAGDQKICRDVDLLVGEVLRNANSRNDADAKKNYLARGLEVLQAILTSPPQVVKQGEPFRLTDGENARLHRLTPERQQQLIALADRFADKEVVVPMRFGSSVRMQVGPLLADLLDSGKLDSDRDAKGVDLLQNLTRLSNQECATGLDRDLLTALCIVHLARANRTMSQGPSPCTCAAEVVSNMLIRNNPSEYVRVASGLVSPEGKVQLRSGDFATRVSDSLVEDGTKRTSLERVVQAALMDYAGPPQGNGHYSNLMDVFVDPTSGQEGTNGVDPQHIATLAAAVLGGQAHFVETTDANANTCMADLQARTGRGEEVITGIDYINGVKHTILTREIKNGRVYFWNPWGHREDRSIKLEDVDHQVDNDGLESLPLQVFSDRLLGYIVPQ